MYSLFDLLERASARIQGKGWGSATLSHEVNSVKKFFKKTPELGIDIGGNVGDYSALLRKKFPDIELHIFEPSSTNISKLSKRFGFDNKTRIIPQAVSNLNGSAELFADSPGSGMGSLIKRKLDHFNVEFTATEVVNTIRFEDYWVTKLEKREIDFVKMDVEGYEFNVLNGFGEALNKTKIIQFEFGGCNIDTRTYFQDFWYFFKEHSFEMYRIAPFGSQHIGKYKEVDEFFSTTNYLCINTR
jgi:FkbM family methyltransferase